MVGSPHTGGLGDKLCDDAESGNYSKVSRGPVDRAMLGYPPPHQVKDTPGIPHHKEGSMVPISGVLGAAHLGYCCGPQTG